VYCESARSLADLRSILTSASSLFSLQGVVFGSDDFSADVGINGRHSPEAWELMYARQKIVTTCRLFENAQPIDMVYINFKDLDGLKKQAEQGAAWGFTGKQVIHPQQVPVVQAAFSPSESNIAWARELIDAYDKHEHEEGKGAFTFRGQTMVDRPLLKRARYILNMTR
jgi:citrate lyase subunit beta-like protein